MSAAVESRVRLRTLTWTLAGPALAVLLLATVVEVWRVVAPTQAQAGYRMYGSLGEAIVMNDVRGAYEFIRRGQDPNGLIAVHDPVLTGGQVVLVSPVVWAAAAGRPKIVLMLLGAGVTFEREADRSAACLADRLGFADIAGVLRAIGGLPPASACPAVTPGPPLLAVASARPRPAPDVA